MPVDLGELARPGGDRPRYVFLGPVGRGSDGRRTTTLEAGIPYCAEGCQLDAITLGGGRLALLALVAAALLGGVAVASAALTVRGARGSTLREDAR